MISARVVERLRELRVFPESVGENAEIFEKCTALETIEQEMANRHFTCGANQFLYFHLNALLNSNPHYRVIFLEEAKQQLGGLGISSEHIEEYYDARADDPELLFALKHGDKYDRSVRGLFCGRANQFSLGYIKKWLSVV